MHVQVHHFRLIYITALCIVFVLEILAFRYPVTLDLSFISLGILYILLNLLPFQFPASRFTVTTIGILDVAVVLLEGLGASSVLLGTLWILLFVRKPSDYLQSLLQILEKGTLMGFVILFESLFAGLGTSEVASLIGVTLIYHYLRHLIRFPRSFFEQRLSYTGYIRIWGFPQLLELIGSVIVTALGVAFYKDQSAGNLFMIVIAVPVLWGLYRLRINFARSELNLWGHQVRDRFIFNSIDYMIIAIDMNRVITLFNKKAQDFFRLSEKEVIGKLYEDVFFSRIERKDRRLLHSLEEGDSYNLRSYPVRIEGKECLFDIYTTPLKNDEGQMIGAVGVFLDVTQQKQLEEEMIHKDKLSMVGQLAAGTVHEIRNPLATAKGHLELTAAKLESALEPEISRHFDIIRTQLDRANYTLNSLLALAKPKTSIKSTVDIQELIDDAVEWAYHSAVANGIQLTGHEYPEEVFVEVDPEQIKQVLINLLYNAFDATPEEGSVEVFAELDQVSQMVAIVVKDNGTGMSEEQVAKIGQPFFTTKQTGTGLGLLVSTRIIESHGGRISAQSQGGQGTEFKVWIPLSPLSR